MPELEDITYSDDEDDVGAEANFNNLETSITVNPIPTTRVHKNHLVSQIIGDLSSTTQTRSMTKAVKDQGGLLQMFNDDFHTSMQEELLQFKMQKVWILVDLPYGKRAIDLESVEARLLVYKQNEFVFEENIKLLNIEVQLRDNALVTLRQKLEKAEHERDDLKLKLEKFQTFSKNLTELLASQTNKKTGLGYNSQIFTRAMFDCDDYLSSESDESWPPSSLYDSLAKPEQDLSHTNRPTSPIIEDWVSNSEDESETNAPQIVPIATPKPVSPKLTSPGKRRNRKACFVCKGLDHLIKGCDYHDKKMAQPTPRNHAHRGFVGKMGMETKMPNSRPCFLNHKYINDPKKGNPQHALKDKGVIDSGCPRHMTGNMSYLSDFEELNGGYVAFEGNPKGGKFDEKVDKGFLVGYSVSSKAFRVFNSRTPIVQETLHVNFLENKPNVVGSSPTWLFDMDSLTRTMNYQPVTAEIKLTLVQVFKTTLTQKKQGRKLTNNVCFFLVWSSGSTNPQNNDGDAAFDGKEPNFVAKKPESEVNVSPSSSAQSKKQDDKSRYRDLSAEFVDCFDNSINEVNAAGTIVPNVGQNSPNSTNTFSAAGPSNAAASPTHRKYSFIDASQLPDDPDMPELEDITYSDDEDDEELLQFKMQKVWILVDLPYGKRAIARIEAIRLFLAYASFMGFMVYQMDVKSAFLYGTIEEEVYVFQPSGFKDPDHPDKVYKVVKALYGLHQAPRACLTKGKSTSTPIDTEKPLLKDPDGEDVDMHTYRSMIGSLMYLTLSRPDIMFAVCACAHFQVTPIASHLHAVKRIFRYLKCKTHLGLWYPKDSPFDLVAYSDSGYAGASLDIKSTTGGCQFLGCRLISCDSPLLGVNTPRSDEDMLELMELTVFLLPKVEVIGIRVNAIDLQVSTVRHKLLLFSLTNWCCLLSAVSSIKYALTVNPNIYVSCIKQFWTTAAVKQVNDVTRLQALVDKKKVVVTEATIQEALHLDDEEGVDCLSNEEIFIELARMGYEKPSTKLTFYKAFFSSQWKFFIHTILQCRKFNFSKYIFDSLVDEERDADENVEEVNAGDAAKRDVSAAHGEVPTVVEEQSIPSPTPPIPPPQPPHDIPSTSQVQQTPPQSPQGEEAGEEEYGEKVEVQKVAEYDVVVLEDDKEEDREVVDAVKDVKEAKVDESAQDQGRTAKSQAKIYKIDLDNANKVLSMQEDKTEPAKVQEVVYVVTTSKLITEVVTAASETITAASTIITLAEAQVPAATLTVAPTRVVAPSRRRKGVVIRDPKSESTTSIIIPAETKSKDKGKGILVEEPKPLKKKQQIEQDEQYAREEDLESLWSLVKERFSTTNPKNFFDDFLLVTLGAMFEKPDIHAQIWKNQKTVHGPAKVKGWKLLESCGVQIITFTSTHLILLVERKYPLLRLTLDQMLNDVRLKVEEESEVSLELLSSLSLVDEFVDEGIPEMEPRFDDEEADMQRVVEESLKSVYDAHRGPLSPMRRTTAPTKPSGHTESPLIYAKLGLADSDIEFDEEVPHVVKIRAQDEGQARPNPGVQIEGHARSNPGDYAEPQPQSSHMVNTRTDADLSAAVQNALQTLLPQIRAEIREEFCTSSGPSDSGRNPPSVTCLKF
nr:uncharacterized mitochondrial protein AtMg00810-like [Tanacetum cinerariifolium]